MCFDKCYFPFLVNLLWSCQSVHGFGIGFSLCCGLLFFSFSFWTRHDGVLEVRRWTRNPLARLRSTPEDWQPFTGLMVSQSGFLYLQVAWICLMDPVFHFAWDFYVISCFFTLGRKVSSNYQPIRNFRPLGD